MRAVDAATAVHVLVGIPEEAQTVTLRIADLGSLTDVAVTDLPDEQQRSGLGAGHNIEIQHVRRTGRQVVAEIRIENPSDASHRLPRGQFDPVSIAEPGPCFRSLTVLSADGRTAGIASEEGCQRGFLPAAHRFVDLTVTLGDPGGGPVTFLPSLTRATTWVGSGW